MASIAAFIIFVLDIWAILNIFGSNADTGKKILWTLLIIILPLVGLLIWWIAGPKKNSAN